MQLEQLDVRRARLAVRAAVSAYCDEDEIDKFVSPLEAELLAAMWFYGLDPLLQQPFGKWRVDFLFPVQHVVVEVDGRQWHEFERDWKRDREIARAHDIVFKRFRGHEVWRDPFRCARDVKRAVDWIDERLHLVAGAAS